MNIFIVIFFILPIILIMVFTWEMRRQHKARLEKQRILEERKRKAEERRLYFEKLKARRAESEQPKHKDYYSNSTDNDFLKDIGKDIKNIGISTGEIAKDIAGKAGNIALMGVGLFLLGKFSQGNSGGTTRVKSYRKTDGTFVKSHNRRYK